MIRWAMKLFLPVNILFKLDMLFVEVVFRVLLFWTKCRAL